MFIKNHSATINAQAKLFVLITATLLVLLLILISPTATRNPRPRIVANLLPSWSTINGSDQYGQWADLTIGGDALRFRLVHSGKYLMGSPISEPGRNDDEGQKSVSISNPYWISDSECTQAFWSSIMTSNPSKIKGDKLPVVNISWDDCQVFLGRLNRKVHGLSARLPSEAEWEYACRAGTQSSFPCNADESCWSQENSGLTLHAVRLKLPNPWGLYDMNGNTYEWCSDWYASYSIRPLVDPDEAPNPALPLKVIRGGSFTRSLTQCRSATRGVNPPQLGAIDIGFRFLIDQSSTRESR